MMKIMIIILGHITRMSEMNKSGENLKSNDLITILQFRVTKIILQSNTSVFS
jgi:hypothetical protein